MFGFKKLCDTLSYIKGKVASPTLREDSFDDYEAKLHRRTQSLVNLLVNCGLTAHRAEYIAMKLLVAHPHFDINSRDSAHLRYVLKAIAGVKLQPKQDFRNYQDCYCVSFGGAVF